MKTQDNTPAKNTLVEKEDIETKEQKLHQAVEDICTFTKNIVAGITIGSELKEISKEVEGIKKILLSTIQRKTSNINEENVFTLYSNLLALRTPINISARKSEFALYKEHLTRTKVLLSPEEIKQQKRANEKARILLENVDPIQKDIITVQKFFQKQHDDGCAVYYVNFSKEYSDMINFIRETKNFISKEVISDEDIYVQIAQIREKERDFIKNIKNSYGAYLKSKEYIFAPSNTYFYTNTLTGTWTNYMNTVSTSSDFIKFQKHILKTIKHYKEAQKK